MSEIVGGVSSDMLKSFVERIENLELEKAKVNDFLKDVFSEAKSEGFDTKILKQLIRIRKMNRREFEEQEEILQTYMNALNYN